MSTSFHSIQMISSYKGKTNWLVILRPAVHFRSKYKSAGQRNRIRPLRKQKKKRDPGFNVAMVL